MSNQQAGLPLGADPEDPDHWDQKYLSRTLTPAQWKLFMLFEEGHYVTCFLGGRGHMRVGDDTRRVLYGTVTVLERAKLIKRVHDGNNKANRWVYATPGEVDRIIAERQEKARSLQRRLADENAGRWNAMLDRVEPLMIRVKDRRSAHSLLKSLYEEFVNANYTPADPDWVDPNKKE
jgi:hypothetical protein